MLFKFTNFANIFTKIWGTNFASALFFGELDFPQEEE